MCRYWPEFSQQGKERIPFRQLLGHQAGLFAFDEPVDRSVVADLDRLAQVMARQKPEWQPGTRQAYHVISLGFYEGELMRRVDPRHRTLGQFFQDEIATPLGLDVYIRLPESFGPPGPGGSLGFADPTTGVGYGYVTSQMGTHLTGDPRDVALRDALDAVIRSRGGKG